MMEERGPTPRTLYRTGGALLILLIATVVVAFMPLGRLGPVLTLAIAFVKALLVGLFFMQVRYASSITRVIAAAGFLWLSILFALTLGDYLTRAPNSTPGYTAGAREESIAGEVP
jgi:cytochrome c oxidase subunit 4